MRARTMLGAIVACLTMATVIAVPSDAPTAAAVPNSFVTGWVPHWEKTRGIEAIDAAGPLFGEVMPFWYSAKNDGSVSLITGTSSTNLRDVVRAARAQGQKVMPSIVDATGKGVLAGILNDPVKRAAHIQSIVAVVNTGIDGKAYDGIDIDYEGFAFTDGRSSWPTTQPGWIAFVQELGTALRSAGKTLSITVPPIWDEGRSGYWMYGPCNAEETQVPATCGPKWAALLPFVDRWRLMVYDWSVNLAGPIAPMYWVDNVIAYTKSVVPANELGKVQLGVPAYGRSWAKVVSGTCPANASLSTRSVSTRNAAPLAAEFGATINEAPLASNNRVIGEKTFTYQQTFTGDRTDPIEPPVYLPPADRAQSVPSAADPSGLAPAVRLSPNGTTTCVVQRTVYFPDTASIVQRVDRARSAGLGGAVIWALGYETADLWPALRSA